MRRKEGKKPRKPNPALSEQLLRESKCGNMWLAVDHYAAPYIGRALKSRLPKHEGTA